MTFNKPDGAGKGDKPRPIDNWEQFSNNFDAIFKKKEKVKEDENSTGHRDGQQSK